MKKIFIVTACVMASPVLGATTGFTGDCDACFQYISCVSKKIITDLSKLGCAQISSGSSEVFGGYDETKAVNACKPSYAAMRDAAYFGDMAKEYVKSHLFESCNYEGDEAGYEYYAFAEGATFARAFAEACVNYGYCECRPGYYIQPRNIDVGLWATNSECRQCPDGGTSDDAYQFGLESCYKTDSPFSDVTGAGEYAGKCNAAYDSEEESKNAWR